MGFRTPCFVPTDYGLLLCLHVLFNVSAPVDGIEPPPIFQALWLTVRDITTLPYRSRTINYLFISFVCVAGIEPAFFCAQDRRITTFLHTDKRYKLKNPFQDFSWKGSNNYLFDWLSEDYTAPIPNILGKCIHSKYRLWYGCYRISHFLSLC